ncbi:hypothetical protein DM01DRAFT_1336796 [Hesseltinella vesiculosa]|uniref:Uncharacterized protein n=1 Tax=Hesseltinella vesiculosa TaxID=101127 RepID=A0A1X2GFA9_9FUNG|nr:hypothetical protein DM01DRAFT_1336796 [Hesseltinella vesiculosa]
MGAQASKQVARKLPTQPRPETFENIPHTSPATLKESHQAFQAVDMEEPEETADPNHLANLSKLGPVSIPPMVTKMRKSDRMLGIINERKRMDQQEIDDPNATQRMTIDKIYALLEQRKHEPAQPLPWTKLSADTGIPQEQLQSLFKHFNTITVMPSADPHDPTARRLGVWVENKEQWTKAIEDTNRRHTQEKQQIEDLERKPTDTTTNESERDRKLKDLFSD